MRAGCFVAVLGLLVAAHAVQAEDAAGPVKKAGECTVLADKHWTEQERFVWAHVCLGENADFNEERAADYGGHLDPKKGKFPDRRVLRPEFVETILLEGKYRHALTRRGVRIAGARFTKSLDLHDAALGHPLLLTKCQFEQGADLASVASPWEIVLDGSQVHGMLDMNALRLGGNLVMNNAELADVDLAAAHIRGTVSLTDTTVNGTLQMSGLRVDDDLFIERRAELLTVDLSGARIGRQFSLTGATVTGELGMDGVQIGQDLLMDEAHLAAVALVGARIEGQLSLTGTNAAVSGILDIQDATVGESVVLRGARFLRPINLKYSKIGSNLVLSGGTFEGEVDLTGTDIGGGLQLGEEPTHPGGTHWLVGSRLKLRNTKVYAIEGDAWPQSLDSLELFGFIYHSLPERNTAWFTDWLAKQLQTDLFFPQPYWQLATVLRAEGHPKVADRILKASKENERERSRREFVNRYRSNLYANNAELKQALAQTGNGEKSVERSGFIYLRHFLWLTALYIIIGHGYAVQWALLWLLFLLVIGTVMQCWRQGWRRPELWPAAVYSFEMLLPLIRLRGQTREFRTGWFDLYFHAHNVFGLILLAFLAAGLSGLAK